MTTSIASRRHFIECAAVGGSSVALAGLGALGSLPRVTAAEARFDAALVRFGPDIEPTVRFIEETPRDELLERLVARIRDNLSYREVVSALLLAGVRNIPGAAIAHHRNVGGRLHTILVINSAHLASIASPAQERWLPILWAVDGFKHTQSRPPRNGRRDPLWSMSAVDERAVPKATEARKAFVDAVENWDEDAADPAAAGLARVADPREVFELLCRYAMRDFRYIGHKAIFVANGWRTLERIGWQHAEPVLRSLARALCAYFHNEGHPNRSDQPADRPWRGNRALAATVRDGWQQGEHDNAATAELLAVFREGNEGAASAAVAAMLNHEIAPAAAWDAVHAGMSEMVMTLPGFNTVHAVTTANAMHYHYRTTGDEQVRLRILLQAAAFVPMFRDDFLGTESANARGKVRRIDEFESPPPGEDRDAVETIFAVAGSDSAAAAGQALEYLNAGGDPAPLIARARRLVFLKGDDAHDYKYSSAVFEDFSSMAAPWRNRYLAAAMFQLRGSGGPDTPLARQIKAIV